MLFILLKLLFFYSYVGIIKNLVKDNNDQRVVLYLVNWFIVCIHVQVFIHLVNVTYGEFVQTLGSN
jgi:hypothetical protein